jgi:ribose transport system ATP-binding protein
MRALRASGVALVFVSHRMDEVAEFCDRATILRNGKNVGTVRMAETSRRDMVELIVGRAVAVGTRRVAGADPPGSVRLEADGLTAGLLREFSLAVRAGEIVGVTGLAGSGASDLGDAVIGRVGVERGRLLVGGAPFSPRGVRRALRAGIALVPADRAAEGLFLSLSLRENLNPNPRPAESAGAERSRRPSALARRVIRRRGEEAATRDVLQRFDIRPPEPERVASTLSGGNAQKLMLGRWLDENPRIVILNEPTTGIDVGARQQIYEYLRRAAAAGAAVIVISSDFHEIAELCDRAVVLYRGYTAAVLEGGSLNTAAVTTAALGEDQ